MPVIGTEVDGLQMEWRLLMFGPVFSSFDAVGTELAPTVSSVAQSYLTFCDPMDCSLPDASFLGFSRQKYWSGLPFPPPGDLLDPGIEPKFPASPELPGRFFTTVPPGKP